MSQASIDKYIIAENTVCAIDYDKLQTTPIDRKPYYVDLFCSLIFGILYFIATVTASCVVPNEQFDVYAKCLVTIIPTIVSIVVSIMLIVRIKELSGGEEDDSGKY